MNELAVDVLMNELPADDLLMDDFVMDDLPADGLRIGIVVQSLYLTKLLTRPGPWMRLIRE